MFENLSSSTIHSISDFFTDSPPSFFDPSARFCDIAKEAFALGEKFNEEKFVRKALRYLLKRFAYKVNAVEEAKDV